MRQPLPLGRCGRRGYAFAFIASALITATCGCYRWQQQLDPFSYLEGDTRQPVDLSSQPGVTVSDLGETSSYDVPAASTAPPTAPPEITVEQALLYTLDNHPRLRARAGEVEVARSELITAGLLPNPQFVVDTDTTVNESGPVEMSGRLIFAIPTGRKQAKAAAAARAGIAEARAAIGAEEYILLTETAEAALEVLYLQELIKLQGELAALAEEAAKLQRIRVEQAVAPATDLLAAEINAAEIQFETINNETLLAVARLRLSLALGMPRPQEVRMTGALAVEPFAKPPLDELLAEVAQVRPEIAQAEAAIEKSRREAVAARAAAIPDIEIGPLYSTELGELEDTAGFRFGTDLPWFDRGQGDVYAAVSEARVNEALRDEVRLTSLHQVANAYHQLRPIEAALAQYEEKIAPLTRRTQELLHDPDAARVLDPVELSDQLRKLGQVRLKHLELRYQHNQIRAQLELLLGRRLSPPSIAPELVPPGQLDPAPPPPPGLPSNADGMM
ncbi:MAG: TolC family protein [Pirellulales bacterium]